MGIAILGQVGLCHEEWQMGMSPEGSQEAAFVVSGSEAVASSDDVSLEASQEAAFVVSDSEALASIDDVSLEGSQEAAFVVSDSVLAQASIDDGLNLLN